MSGQAEGATGTHGNGAGGKFLTFFLADEEYGLEFGVVVDQVSAVADVEGEGVEDAPSFGAQVDTEYLLGIARAGERVKLLLDIDRVLGSDEVQAIQSGAGSTSQAA